tara:strand:- start:559 stop:816 length:258 start_codon:yes stop_codon:yes gene_type:complete
LSKDGGQIGNNTLRRVLFRAKILAAQPQTGYQRLVASDVFLGEIVQETAAFRHQGNQSAPGMNVLFVDTQMAGKLMDSRGEYRYL